jgi:hypothetical protein
MNKLRSSTSILAIIEFWNQHQRARFTSIPAKGTLWYMWPQTVYIRPLTVTERESVHGDDLIVYGAFHCHTAQLLGAARTTTSLQVAARENDLVPVLVH